MNNLCEIWKCCLFQEPQWNSKHFVKYWRKLFRKVYWSMSPFVVSDMKIYGFASDVIIKGFVKFDLYDFSPKKYYCKHFTNSYEICEFWLFNLCLAFVIEITLSYILLLRSHFKVIDHYCPNGYLFLVNHAKLICHHPIWVCLSVLLVAICVLNSKCVKFDATLILFEIQRNTYFTVLPSRLVTIIGKCVKFDATLILFEI